MDEANAALLAEEGMAVEGVIGVCGMGPKPKPLCHYYGGTGPKLAGIVAAMVERIPHSIYCEPFMGMAGVLLAKRPSPVEILGDLSGDLVNLFRVVRDRDTCHELIRRLRLTPYARQEWEYARANFATVADPIERARLYYVLLEQSMVGRIEGGAWRCTGQSIERHVPSRAVDFQKEIGNIERVMHRLINVEIDNRLALDTMRRLNPNESLWFIDPPYRAATRANGTGEYTHEMTEADHAALLAFCVDNPAAIILKHYPDALYDATLLDAAGWKYTDIAVIANSALNTRANGRKNNPNAKSIKRVERLYMNERASRYQTPTLIELMDGAA